MSLPIAELGGLIARKRGGRGIRAAAAEAGVSSATLSRVENGNMPDLETFAKICKWLDVDPREFLGVQASPVGDAPLVAHFRKDPTVSQETAFALGELILAAQRAMQARQGLLRRQAMQRGFKARAERLSVDAREDLSLAPHERLDPWAYATSLGVAVMGANELDLPEIVASQLLEKDPSSWSGLTLGHGKETLIILNSSHGGARQCSTLMHELSHVRLGHMPASVQLSTTGMLLLSDYSPEQEDEADWLMGALLLPRSALVFQRSKGKTREQIAEAYGVSEELCRWRIQMTGIEAQLRYRR